MHGCSHRWHLEEAPRGWDEAQEVLSAHGLQTFLQLLAHPSLVNGVPLQGRLSLCDIFNLLRVNTLCTQCISFPDNVLYSFHHRKHWWQREKQSA